MRDRAGEDEEVGNERHTALKGGLLSTRASCLLCADAFAVVATAASHLDVVGGGG